MATYKSGYKRSNNDRFLTFAIVGFGAVILALALGLIIYNIVNVQYKYSDFENINSFYAIQTQEEDEYLVYYYSESCGYCNEIKEDVLNFAHENNAGIKMYLLDAATATGSTLVITDPTSGATMDGTPSLIIVKNGVIVQMSPGYINVLQIIDEINSGTNNYIN